MTGTSLIPRPQIFGLSTPHDTCSGGPVMRHRINKGGKHIVEEGETSENLGNLQRRYGYPKW